jgi:polar amino acid transport system ATP-binding protein
MSENTPAVAVTVDTVAAAPAQTPVLQIVGAVKSFVGTEVLHGIDITVNRGEVVGIIGPSGSGKSTILRCATLLERLDKGSLSYDGEYLACADENGTSSYKDAKTLRAARSKFGLVFQNFNLFPHYTVWKNITDAPLHVQKRDRDEVERVAHDLLAKMGLSGKEKAVPCELSGGQQQRVSIARALALNPHILFFDEPTSALDPELTGEILKVIRDLAAEHMTMVIVTHEMTFARDVADRIAFMDGGVIVEEGTARQVVDNPQQERTKTFLGKFTDGA